MIKQEALQEWFKKNFENMYLKMKTSDHAYNPENQNNYHLEGDVWTHTTMVLKEAYKITKNPNIIMASLLHDIGKPDTREENHDYKKVTYLKHESHSTYLAFDVLKKAEEDNIMEFDFIRVLEIINWHSDLHHIQIKEHGFNHKEANKILKKYPTITAFNDILEMSKSDSYGRIVSKEIKERTSKLYDYCLDEYGNSFMRNFEYNKKQKEKEKLNPKPKKIKKVIMTIGLQNTGKTTYINELIKDNEDAYQIVSFDELYIEYGDGDYEKGVARVFNDEALEKEMKNEYENRLNLAYKTDKIVIIDKTSISEKARRRSTDRVKHSHIIEMVVFLESPRTLYDRNIDRKEETGKYITRGTLKNLVKEFQMPHKGEADVITYKIGDKYKEKVKKKKQIELKDYQKKIN